MTNHRPPLGLTQILPFIGISLILLNSSMADEAMTGIFRDESLGLQIPAPDFEITPADVVPLFGYTLFVENQWRASCNVSTGPSEPVSEFHFRANMEAMRQTVHSCRQGGNTHFSFLLFDHEMKVDGQPCRQLIMYVPGEVTNLNVSCRVKKEHEAEFLPVFEEIMKSIHLGEPLRKTLDGKPAYQDERVQLDMDLPLFLASKEDKSFVLVAFNSRPEVNSNVLTTITEQDCLPIDEIEQESQRLRDLKFDVSTTKSKDELNITCWHRQEGLLKQVRFLRHRTFTIQATGLRQSNVEVDATNDAIASCINGIIVTKARMPVSH